MVIARAHRVFEVDVFDLILRRELSKPRAHPFFFLQVGANDGEMHDPIHRYVDEYRWEGLLVEPIPKLFAELQKNYATQPQLRFANVALSTTDGRLTLYTVRDDPKLTDWARGITSFDRNVLLSNRKHDPNIRPELIEKVLVEAVTFRTLAARYNVEHIDLLQIDTEGFDFEVLKMFDFGRYVPAIIQYEHRHLKLCDQVAAHELLRKHQYKISSQMHDTVAWYHPH
jgi:FkbM family methyltransferase